MIFPNPETPPETCAACGHHISNHHPDCFVAELNAIAEEMDQFETNECVTDRALVTWSNRIDAVAAHLKG